jgi:hypothetical protein
LLQEELKGVLINDSNVSGKIERYTVYGSAGSELKRLSRTGVFWHFEIHLTIKYLKLWKT